MRTSRKRLYRCSFGLCLALILGLTSWTSALAAEKQIYLVTGPSTVSPVDDEKVFSELDRSGQTPAASRTNTLMIYMVGTNLERDGGYATDDFMDMMDSGMDPENSNVLIYTGGTAGWHSNIPSDKNAVYRIEKKQAFYVTASSSISDMGDPRSLADFINYAAQYFPAEHYGLVLWDHGGGPLLGFGHDDFFASNELGKNANGEDLILNDEVLFSEFKDAMMRTPFGENQKLDLVFYNACLISSLEIAKMWQPYADTLVSSEESISGFGVPYTFLKELNSKDLSGIAPEIVSYYGDYYKKLNEEIAKVKNVKKIAEQDATLSAIDLSAIDEVSSALDALFTRAIKGLKQGDFEKLQQVREQMYEFAPETAGSENSYDLVDCMDCAEKMEALYPQEAKAFKDAVAKAVISETSNVSRAHGLMMYFPYHNEMYETLLAPAQYPDLVTSEAYATYLDMVLQIRESGNPDLWLDDSASETEEEPETTRKETETEAPAETAQVIETETAPAPETEQMEETETMTATETTEPAETETQARETQTAETAAASDTGILWTLADPSWAKVTYSICEVRDEGAYRPILCDVPVTPDASGQVLVPFDQEVLCMQSDVTFAAKPWTSFEISRDGEKVEYRLPGARMASGPEFTAPTDDGQPLVTVLVSADTASKEVKIRKIRPEKQPFGGIGFDDIDLDDWEGVYEFQYDYQPEYNEDGTCKPIGSWTRTDNVLFRMLPVEQEMHFILRPVAELSGEYAVLIQERTAAGKVLCSKLIPFPKEEGGAGTETVSTPAGTVTAAVYSDHAEILSYEGSDTALTLPDKIGAVPVTVIAPKALRNAETVTDLVIPEGVASIGESGCAGMTSLQKVTLPSSLQAIEYHAFDGDSALVSVEIPEGTRTIGRAAFQGCESLTKVEIPGSITLFGHAVFAECPQLSEISLTDGEACRLSGNMILSADGETLLAVPEGAGTYVKVPDGVKTIAYGAFSGSKTIKKVELPAGLIRIENFAFYNCTSLVGIDLPDSVEYIGARAFGASTMIFMGDYERAQVSQVRLGTKVRHLGINVFNGVNLTAFEVDDENTSWAGAEGFLTNKAKDMIWEAPAGLTGTVTVPDGIRILRENVFATNINVTDFILPDSLVSIPENCFPVDHYDTVDGEIKPVYTITLHCSAGSAAAEYADKYGITHVEP